MNSCDDAPWAQAPAGESLPYPQLTDEEFHLECTMKWGFLQPDQLPPVSGMYGCVGIPGLWNTVTEFLSPDDSGDLQMAGAYTSMQTQDVLPPEVFSDKDLKTLPIYSRAKWGQKEHPPGKVFCPVSNQLYSETMKAPAFTRLCGRYTNPGNLLKIMGDVYPSVAKEVASALDAIENPNFYLPVKCAKDNKRKTMESDLQQEAKEGLIKKVITSAYYRILFNKHDLDAYPADELTIMRAMCPLREEDETNTDSV